MVTVRRISPDERDFEDGLAEPRRRLRGDLKIAAPGLSDREVRALTDYYYDLQAGRLSAKNRIRAAEADGEPNALMHWMYATHHHFEEVIRSAMDEWVSDRQVGRWLKSITGIGPVLSAGLLAQIDVEKAPNVGHVWVFAGLAANQQETWLKGMKRPWNASLKRVCLLAADCFCKFQNHPKQSYGQLWADRKKDEIKRNEAGQNRLKAAEALDTKNFGDDTDAKAWYLKGMLPPAQLQARTNRWVAKIFLEHVFEVLYWEKYGILPPEPYIIGVAPGNVPHSDYIGIPHLREYYPDFWEAKRAAGRLGHVEALEGRRQSV